MFLKLTTICFFLTMTVMAAHAAGKNLGTVGQVYPVLEPDALAEITAAVTRVDWKKAIDRKKTLEKVKKFRPENLYPLPVAVMDKTFLVDMTYTLDIDIPDGKGGVLYPKGFSFNPLYYVNLTSILVVIDAGDKRQIEWFNASPHADDYRTRLLLSGGNYYDLTEKLERPVFYLMDNITRRLRLAAVPSVIRQQGNRLEVREVRLPHE